MSEQGGGSVVGQKVPEVIGQGHTGPRGQQEGLRDLM